MLFLKTIPHDLNAMTKLINKNKCYIHVKTIIKDILVHNVSSVPEKKQTCSTCQYFMCLPIVFFLNLYYANFYKIS